MVAVTAFDWTTWSTVVGLRLPYTRKPEFYMNEIQLLTLARCLSVLCTSVDHQFTVSALRTPKKTKADAGKRSPFTVNDDTAVCNILEVHRTSFETDAYLTLRCTVSATTVHRSQ